MYTEDDLLPLSGLQHLAFCQRQAALIYVENIWQENVLTTEGRLMHDRAHSEEIEVRGDVYISRGLRLRSLELGLIGMTDVVEFHRLAAPGDKNDCIQLAGFTGWWKPYIVEYKHGSPKPDSTDEVQLCAQVICLEEMLGIAISSSSFFYGRPRRRHIVQLDKGLRQTTINLALQLHALIKSGITPPPQYTHKCRNCSLLDDCMPKAARPTQKVAAYLHKAIYEEIA